MRLDCNFQIMSEFLMGRVFFYDDVMKIRMPIKVVVDVAELYLFRIHHNLTHSR